MKFKPLGILVWNLGIFHCFWSKF